MLCLVALPLLVGREVPNEAQCWQHSFYWDKRMALVDRRCVAYNKTLCDSACPGVEGRKFFAYDAQLESDRFRTRQL